jgi:metal-responsive CopG/Arc/MetJ family transcriptional regulator
MSHSRISVRLDKDTQRRLDEAVRATGKNESELVRDALAAFLLNGPSADNCLELAQRRGLIGCAKRLPADLSTNREHFEGYCR